MSEEKLITTEELTESLSISPWTVRDLTRKGIIPAYRLTNRRNLYDEREVFAIIRENHRRFQK